MSGRAAKKYEAVERARTRLAARDEARRARPYATGWVYRCFDADGALLYVGKTHGDPLRRVGAHLCKDWWPSVRRLVMTPYVNELVAESVEALAILAEEPRHNVAHVTNPETLALHREREQDPTGPSIEVALAWEVL